MNKIIQNIEPSFYILSLFILPGGFQKDLPKNVYFKQNKFPFTKLMQTADSNKKYIP